MREEAKDLLRRVGGGWPLATVMLGALLTLAWGALLVWVLAGLAAHLF